MNSANGISRRGVLTTGLASAAAAAFGLPSAEAAIRPKAPGETKVVYLGGDQLHNGLGQRQSLRGVFSRAKWRFLATEDARYVTPEFIADADLLIITRWGGPIEGWSPEPIIEGAVSGDGYMSDELEQIGRAHV